MKKILFILSALASPSAAFLWFCILHSASSFAQKTVNQNEQLYTIQSDNCVMTVDANNGGKVISLKCDGKELIAQHAKSQGQDPSQGQRPMRWENPNDFGSTFWPAPQSEWNWPPIATYDSKPYAASMDKSSVKLTSDKDAKYPYVFTKIYTPLGKGAFQIEYIIEDAGDKEVKVAPWEITRVPSGGFIFCDAPEIYPTTEMTYTTEMGWQWIQFIAKRQNRKTFADCKGWLAFANDGLLFVKQFPDITSQEAAPGEEDFEIYFNQGQTYTEIENQGKYATLAPGEKTSWTVKWTVKSIDPKATKTELKALTEAIIRK